MEYLVAPDLLSFAEIDPVPHLIPPPPQTWVGGFRRLANEVGLSEYDLQSSYARIQQFLDPILTGEAKDLLWNPESWSWK